jgi:tRNA U55 pseudouridine synthase TruB
MIIDYEKHIGESMQDVVNRFKKQYKITDKVAFAGRLDPLAFGIVRLLTGDDCKLMDEECKHDKIYTFSTIHGFQSDTYDILGLVTNIIDDSQKNNFKEELFDEEKTITQQYPPYSSKTIDVDGKKVRLWEATKYNMNYNDIPTKEVKIHYIKKINENFVDGNNIYNTIKCLINTVNGDFRQKEILEKWEKNIDVNKIYKCCMYETKISSGGYVRSIANSMGSVAFNICRKQYI